MPVEAIPGNSAGAWEGFEAGWLGIPTLRERRRFYRICPNVANMFLHRCNYLTYKANKAFRSAGKPHKVNLRRDIDKLDH